jgi:phosphomannomutase
MSRLDRWEELQNGSDIRGNAIKVPGNESVNLTGEAVAIITKAFICWLSDYHHKDEQKLKVAVGSDSRITGPEFRKASLCEIARNCEGAYDCAIASTPAMFMSCIFPEMRFDGSIMITASHLPFNRNGMKFFTKDGGLEKSQITDILNIARELGKSSSKIENDPENAEQLIRSLDLMSVYAKDLTDTIRRRAGIPVYSERPLEDLHILVDAGNGAGGFFVDQVLKPLGAITTGSQYLEPDGYFPNHIPNPEDDQAMESLKQAVLRHGADFGVIFDTDVDRAGAVDRFGREINRNRIIALMSAIILEEFPGTTIVTDSITSSELRNFIEEKLHGRHHRFKRGYKNVINEAIRLNAAGEKSHLAIETSGHGAVRENYFLDDGAYLIARILIKIAQLKKENRTIDELISDLREPIESKEFRIPILNGDFKTYGEKILSDLLVFAQTQEEFQIAPDNYEGVRIAFDEQNGNGWFLLRMSLHDPLMPLNVESNTPGGIRRMTEKLYKFLRERDFLDTASIADYLDRPDTNR